MPGSLMTPQMFRDAFADVAINDLVVANKIYAIPLYRYYRSLL